MRALLAVFLLVLAISENVFASREGMLTFSDFAIKSDGLEGSGKISMEAKQGAMGVTYLKLNAFNREILLDEEQLRSLQNIYLNGVQLSYERGNQNSGGRTVYVIFSRGFTAGVEVVKILAVNEKGEVSIVASPNE